MNQDHHDRSVGMADRVATARASLAAHLGWSAQVGRPRDGEDPSIEAAAKRRMVLGGSLSGEIERLYDEYIEAVNALWLLAEQSGLTEQLVREFARKHRAQVRDSGIDRADLSSEATLAMRAQCIAWACCGPRRPPLHAYARVGITHTLLATLGFEASAATGFGFNAARIRSKRSDRVVLDEDGNDNNNE